MTPSELDVVMLDLAVIVMATPIAILSAIFIAIAIDASRQPTPPHERAAIRWAMRRFVIGVVAVVTCVMVMVGCGGSGGGQGDKPVGDGSNITKGDNRG